MEEKVIYCNNAMLNLPGFNSTAAMSVKLTLGESGYGMKENYPALSGSLCISDCNRVIELDCYATTKEEYANVVFKLNTLANNIKAALDGILGKEAEFYEKYDRVDARVKQEVLDKANENTD